MEKDTHFIFYFILGKSLLSRAHLALSEIDVKHSYFLISTELLTLRMIPCLLNSIT